MTLEELKKAAPDLATMGHPERIRLVGWWLHVHKGRAHFQAADIGKCYDDLSGRQDNSKIWGERLQGRQSIGSSIHQDNRQGRLAEVLLMFQLLINRHEHFETGFTCRS